MPHKSTVVILIPTLQGGGAERIAINLATGFSQQNFEVHVVLTLKNEINFEFKSNGKFKIHYFNKHLRWVPRAIRGLILAPILDKFIIEKCGNPHLVLSSLEPTDRILCHSKLNTYLIIQNTISKENNNHDRMKSIYTQKPVVCCSQGVKKDFDQLFNSQFTSYHIYNPVDINFIKTKSIEFKPKYSNYLVHVAKFKEQKRHDILIKAYHQSGVKDVLILVGDGPTQERCLELVNDLELNEKVIFVGFQSNHYPFIKHAKLMLLSSDFEGLPTVIMESLALNTPVISTDCPSGPSEMLPNQNLCPVGNVEKLALLIKQSANNPSAFIQPLDEKFHLDFAIKKYMDLI
jgi:glycosyltransferase involved in cell wall biosynthesis